MSCVMSVVGICSSDDGLKISPSQNAQTPPNAKQVGHGDSCLYLKFLIRIKAAAPFLRYVFFSAVSLFSKVVEKDDSGKDK